MRPVDKGAAPSAYSHYRDAVDDLVERLGCYCSYCEKRLDNAPEVEHVQPKSLNPSLALEWSNFLLACKTCNSHKSNKPVNRTQVAFPDTDNTFRGLLYKESTVQIAPGLTGPQEQAVKALVALVQLDRHPENQQRHPTPADKRWLQRRWKWQVAQKRKAAIEECNGRHPAFADKLRDQAAEEAGSGGYFSVWMSVFADDPEMKRRLRDSFTGTAQDCFDASGNPVPRPGGML